MSTEQQYHYLKISSSLGKDALTPLEINVSEKIGGLFAIDLLVIANKQIKALDSMIGQQLTISLQISDAAGSPQRYFNGHINAIQEAGGSFHNAEGQRYQLSIVPKAWFATQRVNCRIFQNLSVIEIVTKVLKDEHGISLNTDKVGSYTPYDYCVQYNESDWQFAQRLLAKEGLFYYFKHSESDHILTLSDQVEAYEKVLENRVAYSAGIQNESRILTWYSKAQATIAATALRSVDFTKPSSLIEGNAQAKVPGSNVLPREVFAYHAEDPLRDKTKTLGEIQLESFTQDGESFEGSSTCRSFGAGHQFSFNDHLDPAYIGKAFVITDFTLHATVPSNLENSSQKQALQYQNYFQAMPAATVFRPPAISKPAIGGVQTATVTGGKSDEIYTDEYGRVKVQFHWDRDGKFDENSSCWIRVAQHWAGKSFGVQFLPRVGHEVVVEFINGDPDQPLITGSVYNGDNNMPYPTPANKEHSGIRSRSTKGGSSDNYNEIRFVDTKGQEEFYLQAEKDFKSHVKNDHTAVVDNNKSTKTAKNESHDIGEALTIHAGKTIVIDAGSSLTLQVGGSVIELADGKINISSGDIIINGSTVKLN